MVNEMNSTKAYLLLQKRESLFLSQVNKAIEFASQILSMITRTDIIEKLVHDGFVERKKNSGKNKGGVQTQKMLEWLWFICAGMRLSQEGFRMTLFSMAWA